MGAFPDLAAAHISEDALLLREMCHRTAGEVAAAMATMTLVRSARASGSRLRQIDMALARLRGFGELNRLLARPMPARVEVAVDLEALCIAIGSGRLGASESRIDLDMGKVWTTGVVARRLLVAAAAFVEEAVRCGLERRAGRMRVVLDGGADHVALTVEDDGPGPRLAADDAMDGVGRAVAAELVGRGEGTLTLVTGRRGTRVTVAMPTGLENDDDVPF